jgi:filamentous hemagglutinin family protein
MLGYSGNNPKRTTQVPSKIFLDIVLFGSKEIKMTKFRIKKLYYALWVAMNLAYAGRADAATPVGPGLGTTLNLDNSLTGFHYKGTTSFTPSAQQITPLLSNAHQYNIDANSIGVFSSNWTSVFFSFSNFVINKGDTATFLCQTGCGVTNNVITRVNSTTNLAEIYGTLESKINTAAFYLLSPNGVILGKNAQINVPGALHIGTTDTLSFGADKLDSNTTDVSTLNVPDSSAFGFLKSGTITLGADDGSGTSNSTIKINSTSGGNVELSAGNIDAVDPGAGKTNTFDTDTKGNALVIEAGGVDPNTAIAPSAITINNRNTLSETSVSGNGRISLETNDANGGILVDTGAKVGNVSSLKSDLFDVTVRGTVDTVSTATRPSLVSAGNNLTVDTGGTVEDVGTGQLTVEAVTGPVNVNSGAFMSNAALVKSDAGDVNVIGRVSATTTTANQNLSVTGTGRLTTAAATATGAVAVSGGGTLRDQGGDLAVTGNTVLVTGTTSKIA